MLFIMTISNKIYKDLSVSSIQYSEHKSFDGCSDTNEMNGSITVERFSGDDDLCEYSFFFQSIKKKMFD